MYPMCPLAGVYHLTMFGDNWLIILSEMLENIVPYLVVLRKVGK